MRKIRETDEIPAPLPWLVMPGFDYNDISRATLVPAMLPRGKIGPYALACALHEVLERGIVPPTPGAFQEILEANADLVDVLGRFYPDDDQPQVPALDTAERHDVLDILGMHFVSRCWPTYGQGDQVSDLFKADLARTLEANGWRYKIET